MVLDDSLHDRKSETRASSLCAVERVKDLAQVFTSDALTIVSDGDL